jgi:hypothetical protein
MPMTKKEKDAFEALEKRLRMVAALRWTAPSSPDVPTPEKGSTSGWVFNAYSKNVSKAWSEPTAHGIGEFSRKEYRHASQNATRLFSTELLALRALRHAMETTAASDLAEVDRRIEAAERSALATPSKEGKP